MRYYTVRIAMRPARSRGSAGLTLVPGMPVEVFIQTERRTMLSYLIKPLMDQARRAFRDR